MQNNFAYIKSSCIFVHANQGKLKNVIMKNFISKPSELQTAQMFYNMAKSDYNDAMKELKNEKHSDKTYFMYASLADKSQGKQHYL